MNSPAQDDLIPFYFGPPGKTLFGLYHHPPVAQAREFGVVLCNPWGQEFIRGHRAVSQMGLRLARQGFPVLRFDYYGTGDSAGADEEGTLGQWQNDLRLAIQELKRRSRVDSLYLFGMRLGASIAATVAAGRDDIEGLVMWEPAVDGKEYLADLTEWHEEKQLYFFNSPAPLSDRSELLGFGLSDTFFADLEKMDLLAMSRRPARNILLIENSIPSMEPREALQRLVRHFEGLGAGVNYRRVESLKMWAEDPDKGLVPHAVLEAAVTWLAQEPV